MELISAFETGSSTISLITALAGLIKEANDTDVSEDPSLVEILSRLRIEAIRLSTDLENRLRILGDRIQEYGLNPTLSLNQQLENLSWYNFIHKSRLKTLREEFYSIHRQLTSFIDDAAAVLICSGRQHLAAEAFKNSLETKRNIDRLFLDPKTPLGTLVDGMLATARMATADLRVA